VELLSATVEAAEPVPVLGQARSATASVLRGASPGRSGVFLGTRFVGHDEVWIHPSYKQRVVESRAEDPYYGTLFDADRPDAPHGVLRNRVFQ
jgi:NAD(P)H-dependent flavin oxidoreductase YrpB (nitropropane dioxygenase family)